jgi:hypothetical protein
LRAACNAAKEWIEEPVPMLVDKPKAAYKKLHAYLENFYCPFFPGSDAAELIERLMVNWDAELKHIDGELTAKEWYNAQAKTLYNSLNRVLENREHELVLSGIKNLITENMMADQLFEKIGGNPEHIPSVPITDSMIYALRRKVLNSFHDEYRENAKHRLEVGAYPLLRKEFKTLCALQFYVETCGMEHPFLFIFK